MNEEDRQQPLLREDAAPAQRKGRTRERLARVYVPPLRTEGEGKRARAETHDDDEIVVLQTGANDLGGLEPLLDVEVGGGLVEHVDVVLLYGRDADAKSLQLSSRQIANFPIRKMPQLQFLHELLSSPSLVFSRYDVSHLPRHLQKEKKTNRKKASKTTRGKEGRGSRRQSSFAPILSQSDKSLIGSEKSSLSAYRT